MAFGTISSMTAPALVCPAAADEDTLVVARARQARGESVTTIARHLGIGRSTLYRALQLQEGGPAPVELEPVR